MIAMLILSGGLTITFWWASRGKGLGRTGSVFVVWGVFLALLMAPLVLWLNLLGLAVFAALCAAAKMKSWKAGVACVLATSLAYFVFGARYVERYRELAALRDKYPPVSVNDRLAYETRGRPPDELHASAAADIRKNDDSQLPEPIAGELMRIEEKLNGWDRSAQTAYRRTYALAALNSIHDRIVIEFTSAQGFGVTRGRSLGVRQEMIDIPDLPALTIPEYSEPTPPEADGEPGELADVREGPLVYPDHEVLRRFHEAGVHDFANRDGFGFVASRERVFGFQPHGFRNQPVLPARTNSSSRWRIVSLELVSLLKHETPSAYVSQNLPRMDELTEAPTRPLDRFESDALSQLRSGEEIVVKPDASELRMFGSLRAAQQCTDCHSVNRGDLLGAFTYHLGRDLPIRKRPVSVAKPVL